MKYSTTDGDTSPPLFLHHRESGVTMEETDTLRRTVRSHASIAYVAMLRCGTVLIRLTLCPRRHQATGLVAYCGPTSGHINRTTRNRMSALVLGYAPFRA
jgi:hypothetical protein